MQMIGLILGLVYVLVQFLLDMLTGNFYWYPATLDETLLVFRP